MSLFDFSLYLSEPPLQEYEEQGKVETDKALKKLRQYYTSKKSTDWGSISQLKDPKRWVWPNIVEQHMQTPN